MVSSYIAWYLFLAGAGGGAFLLGSFVDFVLRFSDRPWFERASSVTDAGLYVGPVLVALSAVFLTLDLGAPEQAFRLFFFPTGSLLSMGAWSIALFCITAVGALVCGTMDGAPFAQVTETALSIIATLSAAFVVVYAGVFLSLYPSVPFLNTAFVPVLFIASALATGAAVLIVIGFFRSVRAEVLDGLDSLLRLDMVLIVLEAVAIAAFVAVSFLAGDPAAQSASAMVSGEYSMLFWFGVVVAGLVVPLSVDAVCLRLPQATLLFVGAASTLVGGVCLRFVLLLAAQRFSLVVMGALTYWM